MPTKTINGAQLYYELTGDGAPLVLVHGSGIDARSWEFVVPAFAEHHRVLTYDRREVGHVPHLTHPAEHAQVAMTFAATASLVTLDL